MSKAKSRTSLVLMELIITILLFSVSSAVCVQLFVHSHLTSIETRDLNNAVNIAQSISEVMSGTDGSLSSIQDFYKTAEGDEDYFVIYYDENFNETLDYENASYAADVTVSVVSKLYNMEINVVKLPDCEVIYTLDSSKYIR